MPNKSREQLEKEREERRIKVEKEQEEFDKIQASVVRKAFRMSVIYPKEPPRRITRSMTKAG